MQTENLEIHKPTIQAVHPAVYEAKIQYSKMQRSWWGFAVAIHEVFKSRAFIDSGYEKFKEFCVNEYPSTSYVTMLKFVSIVSCFETSIEEMLEDNPNYVLPSYEACYTISALYGKDIPKKDVSNLFNEVIESKISYVGLRAKIKEIAKRDKPPLPIGAVPVEPVSSILFDIRSLIVDLPNIKNEDVPKISDELRTLLKVVKMFLKTRVN